MKNYHLNYFQQQDKKLNQDIPSVTICSRIYLSKDKICKIIQLGGFFGSVLGELAQKVIEDISFLLAVDNLSILISNMASKFNFECNKQIWKKITQKKKL